MKSFAIIVEKIEGDYPGLYQIGEIHEDDFSHYGLDKDKFEPFIYNKDATNGEKELNKISGVMIFKRENGTIWYIVPC